VLQQQLAYLEERKSNSDAYKGAAFADISSSFGLTSKYHTCTGRLFNVTKVNMDYNITSRSYFKRDLFL
jgi:hypothetical protein